MNKTEKLLLKIQDKLITHLRNKHTIYLRMHGKSAAYVPIDDFEMKMRKIIMEEYEKSNI